MLQRKIHDIRGEKRYCVIGPRMAVDFHVSGLDTAYPCAGLESHYKTCPSYMADRAPFSDCCWLTGVRCWGDGTSLYATEFLLPLFREGGLDEFWPILEREYDRRDRDAFGEPPSAGAVDPHVASTGKPSTRV